MIVKIDQAKAAYLWRRFYTDSNNLMKNVSAVALNPSSTLLAVHCHSDDFMIGYVFAVDTLNGGLASSPAKINHNNKFIVRSAGLKMKSNGNILLAFDSEQTDTDLLPGGYAARLRAGAYNSNTSQMIYLT